MGQSRTTGTFRFLACAAIGNAILIAVLVQHFRPEEPAPQSTWLAILDQYQSLLEAIVLCTPALVLGYVVARVSPRTGVILGISAAALTSAVAYADLLSVLLLREHLWSESAGRVILNAAHWIFTAAVADPGAWGALFVWLACQAISTGVAILLGKRPETVPRPPRSFPARSIRIGLAIAILVLPVYLRHRYLPELRQDQKAGRGAHPLGILNGLASASVSRPRIEPGDAQTFAWLVSLRPQIARKIERYRSLQVTSAPKRKPDVLLVICDALRHDAFSPLDSPNIAEYQARSLVSQFHLSSGHESNEGFFGLLFGLDFTFHAIGDKSLRPALPRLLSQAGYRTVFLAVSFLEFQDMTNYINEDCFDRVEIGQYDTSRMGNAELNNVYDGDRRFVEKASDMFAAPHQPLFMILYLYSTHHDYRVPKDEQVFTPTFPDARMPFPPWRGEDSVRARNRYRNAVHYLDKILAPLLSDDRITLISGDHGESLGEDGLWFHATAMSHIQMRTPLVLHIPGGKPGILHEPTSHLDVLPTLLDAIGIQLNDPAVLPGCPLNRGDPKEPRALLVGGLLGLSGVAHGPGSTAHNPDDSFYFVRRRLELTLRGEIDARGQYVEADHEEVVSRFHNDLALWARRNFPDAPEVPKDFRPALQTALQSESDPDLRDRIAEVLKSFDPAPAAPPQSPTSTRPIEPRLPREPH